MISVLRQLVEQEQQELYVRFGEPPAGGKSTVWNSPNVYSSKRPGDSEGGLSVYPIEWDSARKRFSVECHNPASLDELLSQCRPAFMLTGEQAIDPEDGYPLEGVDGEPLLSSFKIIRKMEYKELFYWGWGDDPPFEEYLELFGNENEDED